MLELAYCYMFIHLNVMALIVLASGLGIGDGISHTLLLNGILSRMLNHCYPLGLIDSIIISVMVLFHN